MTKKTPDPNLVIIDDREPDFMQNLLASYGVKSVVNRLKFGDYAFYPHGLTALIELKSVTDLLNSMKGRLVAQAHGIAESADLAFIMIRGRYTEGGGKVTYYAPTHPKAGDDGWVTSGWSWDAFQAIKADMMLLGIDFIDCPNENEAAREIVRLVQTLCRDEHKWLQQRTRPEILTLDTQYRNSIWALAAFDGIGPDTAEAMLKAYGSVQNVISSTFQHNEDDGVEETAMWFAKRVDGLGSKRAQRFIEEVTQQWSVQ